MSITFEHLPRVTSRWGQWYQHTIARDENGREVYRIQTRRRYYGRRIGHRMDTLTIAGAGCVPGTDHAWGERAGRAE
jgi:hypothetical protein